MMKQREIYACMCSLGLGVLGFKGGLREYRGE